MAESGNILMHLLVRLSSKQIFDTSQKCLFVCLSSIYGKTYLRHALYKQ